METLKVAQIKSSDNYRRTMDKQAFNELVLNIKVRGVIQPVLIVKNGKGYQVKAGHRRFAAAVKAGLKEVPVIIKEMDDIESLEIALIENIHREDPNPMDDAIAFEKLFKAGKHSVKTLAKTLNKEVSFILGRMKLLSLPKKVQKIVQTGELGLGMAQALTRVTDKVVLESLIGDIIEEEYITSVDQLQEAINDEYPELHKERFDITGCKACKHMENVKDMFPELATSRCKDSECFNAKSERAMKERRDEEDRKALEDGVGKPGKATALSPDKPPTRERNSEQHSKQHIERFMLEQLPKRLNKPLGKRMVIHHLLRECTSYQVAMNGEVFEMLALYVVDMNKKLGLYEAISMIPEKKLDAVITATAKLMVPITEYNILLMQCPEAEIDTAKEIKPDEDYLKSFKKAELQTEFKANSYAIGLPRKTDMIAALLEVDKPHINAELKKSLKPRKEHTTWTQGGGM